VQLTVSRIVFNPTTNPMRRDLRGSLKQIADFFVQIEGNFNSL
jgi:hypothetical protein